MSQVRRPSGQEPQPTPPGGKGKTEGQAGSHTVQLRGKQDAKNVRSKIGPQWTSGSFLEKTKKTKMESKGTQIKTKTDGVKAFFSGNAGKYEQFLTSIRKSGLT